MFLKLWHRSRNPARVLRLKNIISPQCGSAARTATSNHFVKILLLNGSAIHSHLHRYRTYQTNHNHVLFDGLCRNQKPPLETTKRTAGLHLDRQVFNVLLVVALFLVPPGSCIKSRETGFAALFTAIRMGYANQHQIKHKLFYVWQPSVFYPFKEKIGLHVVSVSVLNRLLEAACRQQKIIPPVL